VSRLMRKMGVYAGWSDHFSDSHQVRLHPKRAHCRKSKETRNGTRNDVRPLYGYAEMAARADGLQPYFRLRQVQRRCEDT
jgi:hypothetical protein